MSELPTWAYPARERIRSDRPNQKTPQPGDELKDEIRLLNIMATNPFLEGHERASFKRRCRDRRYRRNIMRSRSRRP